MGLPKQVLKIRIMVGWGRVRRRRAFGRPRGGALLSGLRGASAAAVLRHQIIQCSSAAVRERPFPVLLRDTGPPSIPSLGCKYLKFPTKIKNLFQRMTSWHTNSKKERIFRAVYFSSAWKSISRPSPRGSRVRKPLFCVVEDAIRVQATLTGCRLDRAQQSCSL